MTVEVNVKALSLGFASLLAVLAGCSSNEVDFADGADSGPGDGGTGDGAVDTPPPQSCVATVTLSPAAPIAQIGTKAATVVNLVLADTAGATGAHPLKVVAMAGGAEIATLVDAPDAASLSGGKLGKVSLSLVPADLKGIAGPTKVTLKATLGCPPVATVKPSTVQSEVYLTRLGATRIGVDDGEGKREPLMYHAVNKTPYSYYPIDPDKVAATSMPLPATGGAELDSAPLVMRTFPAAPWDGLNSPSVMADGSVIEDGVAYPVSLDLGTKPDLIFTLAKTVSVSGPPVPAGVGVSGTPLVRIALDGQPATDPSSPLADGGKQTIRLATSPVPTVGRYDVTLKWHFEAKGPTGWVNVVGTEQTAVIRLYGVLGNTTGTSVPNMPWVAVVDKSVTAAKGKTTAAEVRAALVKEIYENFGLFYDRKSGASAYTGYSGWASAAFELGLFISRSRGSIVNCTDCASILSTYANMVGAKLHYAIIRGASGAPGFSLNPIMGIGATTFGSPFDSGRFSFSYHAVTTQDSTVTINDATLALDGDSDPTVNPHTKLLVQDIAGKEYLTRLSPGTPVYTYVDQITSVK